MKVVVLGAGVIGVTSAFYLAEAGHEVAVLERRNGVALETSFANAGEISPGFASPWAAPDVPRKALPWLLMRHAPLILRLKPDPAMLEWLLSVSRNCTSIRYARNKRRMMRLAEYSREKLAELRAATDITYDARTLGTLQLFRKTSQVNAAAKDITVLERHGVPFELLDVKGCVAVEPGLANASAAFVAGLRLPRDETGDCFKFTNALANLARRRQVSFQFDTHILGLTILDGRIEAVRTNHGEVSADVFIVAMGSHSSALVRPLGLRLPVYPVKGYSITAPIAALDRAPQSTIMDETYKVAITRLGDRIRVGGMAEVSGYGLNLDPRRRETLEHVLQSLFPGAGDLDRASFWSGLRPMTPDGPPVVGPTPIVNLFLNTGHGTLGWTMACGSGRLIADIVSGSQPEIESEDLGISRYGR